jgi:hypothetical protein
MLVKRDATVLTDLSSGVGIPVLEPGSGEEGD